MGWLDGHIVENDRSVVKRKTLSPERYIAECARLLAMNIAHYQSKYGELPLSETLAMLGAGEPNAEQLELLVNSMEILVGVLGNVVTGVGEAKH